MRVRFDDLPTFLDHALTDGAFDPLHAGHVAYLQAAHQITGAPLLVSVASDADIRAKGREPLLPVAQRAAVLEALGCVSAVHVKDRPTEAVLEQMRPVAYVKGADWRDVLPHEQVDVCARYVIPIRFTVDTPVESSSRLLADWSVRDADRQLDTLEAYMAQQAVTPAERYDREYFEGQWRTTAPAYTLEGRRKAEGRHPKILRDLFGGMSVLDVGCGPGFLVQMLRELGVDAGGIDPSREAVALAPHGNRVVCGSVESLPPKIAQVVICREVLEHLTVAEVNVMVSELFRVARKAVYITTRFHPSPRSVFDVTDEREADPTHQTLMTQPMLRALCVLNGGKRRRDWESALDWQNKGRCLAYEVGL